MEANHDQTPPPPPSHSPPHHSLAATAALNAGIQNEERRSPGARASFDRARRRSSIRMNLNLNDPSLPGPGELQMSPTAQLRHSTWPASPTHHRAPSLGELHQELESEQEAQVNRLLGMIRQQQSQIQALQSSQTSSAIDDSTPPSERASSLPHSATASQQNLAATHSNASTPHPRSPMAPAHPNLSRHSSYRASGSRGSSRSPSLRPLSGVQNDSSDLLLGGPASRDESAFYQAETQMLTRENQMLKLRIRELERQLGEFNPTSPITHTPVTLSNLHGPPLDASRVPEPALPETAAAASLGGDAVRKG